MNNYIFKNCIHTLYSYIFVWCVILVLFINLFKQIVHSTHKERNTFYSALGILGISWLCSLYEHNTVVHPLLFFKFKIFNILIGAYFPTVRGYAFTIVLLFNLLFVLLLRTVWCWWYTERNLFWALLIKSKFG